MKLLAIWRHISDERGFSLVEMTTVAAVIGFISASLILNFSRTRLDLAQSVNLVKATVRQAQSSAVSSLKYSGYTPCGYGIHYIDATHLAIYAGPNAAMTNCAGINRNYQAGEDAVVVIQPLLSDQVRFTAVFSDIYFEPPDPRTWLNNTYSLGQAPLAITVSRTGGSCPQECRTIYVYSSGKIDNQ